MIYFRGYFKLDVEVNNQEVTLLDLMQAVVKSWILIGTGVLVGLSLMALYSFSLPDFYTSSLLASPSEESKGGGLSGLAGKFGGLASIAGIDLAGAGGNRIDTALAIIDSRAFAERLIEKHDLLIPLMAAKSWDRRKQELLVDQDMYDSEGQLWVRDVEYPRSAEPSSWEAYEEYRKVVSISQDKDTGFVKISVSHVSPLIARDWTKLIFIEINELMREQEVTKAKKSISYLEEQLVLTSVAEMKSIFYNLIGEQNKAVMLAHARENYILDIIDPPVIAEEKSGPARILFVILGGIVMGMLGIFYASLRFLLSR